MEQRALMRSNAGGKRTSKARKHSWAENELVKHESTRAFKFRYDPLVRFRLHLECSEGHSGCWTSSKVLCHQNEQVIYANSMLIAAGCFISGNNFDKLALLPNFLDLVSSQMQHTIECKHYISLRK